MPFRIAFGISRGGLVTGWSVGSAEEISPSISVRGYYYNMITYRLVERGYHFDREMLLAASDCYDVGQFRAWSEGYGRLHMNTPGLRGGETDNAQAQPNREVPTAAGDDGSAYVFMLTQWLRAGYRRPRGHFSTCTLVRVSGSRRRRSDRITHEIQDSSGPATAPHIRPASTPTRLLSPQSISPERPCQSALETSTPDSSASQANPSIHGTIRALSY